MKEQEINMTRILKGLRKRARRLKKRLYKNDSRGTHFSKQMMVVGGTKQITLRKICKAMQIPVPKKFKGIQDQVNNDLTTAKKRIQKGTIYFILFDNIKMKAHLTDAIEKGASIIFVDKNEFERSGLDLDEWPCILMDDKIEQVGRVFSEIRKSYSAKTIAITGTVGKTTTNKFCKTVIGDAFETFSSGGNLNSYAAVGNHIAKRTSENYDVYIQEVGAAAINSVRKSGSMLRPDAFILLNVTNHHMNNYGTYEKLFEDKSSIDDYVQEDGVVITNFDDEGIASHKFKHQVISFGINTERPVDFRAKNIVQNKELLEFDVEYGDNTVHIQINVIGKHNTYNALAAFTAAKWLGISDEKIKQSFLSYRSRGIRQNFQNIGGRYLFIDCYNVCEASLLATLTAVEEFEVDEGNKKVAVLGGENKMGAIAAEAHTEFGHKIAKKRMDEFVLFGTEEKDQESIDRYGDAFSMLKGMNSEGRNDVKIYTELDDITNYLKNNICVGDLVLVKVILWLDAAIAVDKAFGTAFSYDYEYYSSRTEDVSEGNWHAHVIPRFGEVEILGADNIDEVLKIPNSISGYPVFRIGKRKFMNMSGIKKIDFGCSVQNIGAGTFFNCSGIETLEIPGNIKIIERGAFRKCTGLKTIKIEEGVTHIAQNAFRACTSLERIEIPDSVQNIENDVFTRCSKVTIYCNSSSFAEKYAKENNISYRLLELSKGSDKN